MKLKALVLTLFLFFAPLALNANTLEHPQQVQTKQHEKSIGELIVGFYKQTGIYAFLHPQEGAKNALGENISKFHQSFGRIIMIIISLILFYFAIKKGFEPLF